MEELLCLESPDMQGFLIFKDEKAYQDCVVHSICDLHIF